MEPRFRTRLGALFRTDCVEWLAGLPDACAELAFADPPYGVGKAAWDVFSSREEYLAWTVRWVTEVRRVLLPRGTLYICGYSEHLADIKVAVGDLFADCRWLVWAYRNRANLRRDWGRSHESLLHLRKSDRFQFNLDAVRVPYNAHTTRYPVRGQAASSQFSSGRGKGPDWAPHPLGGRPRDVMDIPVLCNGMKEKTAHPTQKPEELLRRVVLASSSPGDLVIDPFGGAGTSYVVCEILGRRWLGCEREEEYCALAATRLEEAARRDTDSLAGAVRARQENRRKVRDGS